MELTCTADWMPACISQLGIHSVAVKPRGYTAGPGTMAKVPRPRVRRSSPAALFSAPEVPQSVSRLQGPSAQHPAISAAVQQMRKDVGRRWRRWIEHSARWRELHERGAGANARIRAEGFSFINLQIRERRRMADGQSCLKGSCTLFTHSRLITNPLPIPHSTHHPLGCPTTRYPCCRTTSHRTKH